MDRIFSIWRNPHVSMSKVVRFDRLMCEWKQWQNVDSYIHSCQPFSMEILFPPRRVQMNWDDEWEERGKSDRNPWLISRFHCMVNVINCKLTKIQPKQLFPKKKDKDKLKAKQAKIETEHLVRTFKYRPEFAADFAYPLFMYFHYTIA